MVYEGIEKATLSVKETAELLGVSENMVYEHLLQGQLPAQKLGKRWIISRNKIMQYIDGGTAVPISRR